MSIIMAARVMIRSSADSDSACRSLRRVGLQRAAVRAGDVDPVAVLDELPVPVSHLGAAPGVPVRAIRAGSRWLIQHFLWGGVRRGVWARAVGWTDWPRPGLS